MHSPHSWGLAHRVLRAGSGVWGWGVSMSVEPCRFLPAVHTRECATSVQCAMKSLMTKQVVLPTSDPYCWIQESSGDWIETLKSLMTFI